MSIVSAIGNVINKMSVATAIDYHIAERNFLNLLKFAKNYQVFIDAPLISDGSVNGGVFLRTYQIKMLWVKKMPKGSTYKQHYDDGITPMRTLVKEFILRLNNEKSAITNAAIFEPVLATRETDIINEFDENTSGVLVEFNLKVIDDGSICTPNVLPAPSVFIFADQTTVTAGTEIRLGWIAFSVDNITIDNGIGEVSAIGSALVTIDNTITYTATATNASGTATDTITITVGNGCDDATAVLKNTIGTILSTTDIPSGDTQDIIAPDGHVHIKKENDGTIANVFAASGATELYVVQNNDVEINGIKEGEVHATETVEIDLEDSGGNPVTPTSITQSGNTFTLVIPSTSLEQALIDATACNIQNAIPTSAKRRAIFPSYKLLHFDTSLPSINSLDYKNNLTGNETPFFTLPCNNFVGLSDADAALAGITKSTARFTNTLGGNVYDGSDGSIIGCVLDHLQQVPDGTRNCLMLYNNIRDDVSLTWAAAMAAADTDTYAGYTNWRLPDLQELVNLLYYNTVSSLRFGNYAPLNYFGLTIDRAFWTRERVGVTGGNRAWLYSSVLGSLQADLVINSSGRIYFPVRKHTF